MVEVRGQNTLIASTTTFPTAEMGDWYVLHTKSRQEKALAADLSAMEIAHFLPLAKHAKYHGKRKVFVELPLYTSYLFLRGSLEEAFRADRTDRVARIIPVRDQRQLDWELSNLFEALERNVTLELFPHLTVGTRVEVRSGPLRGVQGIVKDPKRPDRLVLQVGMLGRGVSLEINGALLDQID